ncbi:MAG: hypothetical protein EXR81_05225 [Gammaproteobacteria bacterium]|nr:hypothetical protein [Gammaproteobacteria bacterium]
MKVILITLKLYNLNKVLNKNMQPQLSSSKQLSTYVLRYLLTFLLLITVGCGYAARPKSVASNDDTIVTGIPRGFENLSQNTTTMVDLYYGGKPIGTTMATFNDNTIRFRDPRTVVALIPDLKNKESVITAFTGNLPNHSELVCMQGTLNTTCNTLMPDIAGVILNPENFRVNLFVNPSYLATPQQGAGLLPNSDAGFSYINSLSAATSGINMPQHNSQSSNIISNNVLAYGNSRLNADVAYGNSLNDPTQQELYLNQFNGAVYNGDWLYQGGMFNTPGNTFVSGQNILGASIGTTLDTVQDTSNNYGTQLQIFLPQAATVNIYKDGRLFVTARYPMGNQILDTSALPSGAYPILIEIRTDQGVLSRQTRFFAKTGMIPPANFPQYYLDAGYLQNNLFTNNAQIPTFSKQVIYETGLNFRLSSIFGANADFTGGKHSNFFTLGAFLLGNGFQIGPQIMTGSHNSKGLGIQALSNFGGLQSTFMVRQIWGAIKTAIPIIPANTDYDDVDPFVASEETSTQESANLGYQLGIATIGFNATRSKQETFPDTYSYGPTLLMTLFQGGGTTVNLNVFGAKTQDDVEVLGQINVYFNSEHWIQTADAGYRSISHADNRAPDTTALGDAGVYWRNYNAAQEGLQVGAQAHAERDTQNVGSTLNFNDRYGIVDATTNYTVAGNGTPGNIQYSAMATTHLAYDPEGAAVGGSQLGDTGVIVYIASPHPNDLFEVYVNDQLVEILRTDHATPIFLAPFATYRISVRDISEKFYNYDQSPQIVTLYRGNMRTLTWHAAQKIIIYGNVLQANGYPFAFRPITGAVEPAMTERNGDLQTEVFNDTHELKGYYANGNSCTIRLPRLKDKEAFDAVGALTCE